MARGSFWMPHCGLTCQQLGTAMPYKIPLITPKLTGVRGVGVHHSIASLRSICPPLHTCTVLRVHPVPQQLLSSALERKSPTLTTQISLYTHTHSSASCSAIKRIVEGAPKQLQEAVAEEVCQQLLDLDPRVTAVQVYMRKPHVPICGMIDSIGARMRLLLCLQWDFRVWQHVQYMLGGCLRAYGFVFCCWRDLAGPTISVGLHAAVCRASSAMKCRAVCHVSLSGCLFR